MDHVLVIVIVLLVIIITDKYANRVLMVAIWIQLIILVSPAPLLV